MNLTTQQVADKLGVSGCVVRRLRDDGKLTDVAVRKEGAKKNSGKYDSKQVNALLKSGDVTVRRRTAGEVMAHGGGEKIEEGQGGLFRRVVRIEALVERLVKVLS